MNEKNIIRAIGNIDDRYLMETIPRKYEYNNHSNFHKWTHVAAAVIAMMLVGGSTVFAAYHLLSSKTEVNGQKLPEIDPMYCVSAADFSAVEVDENDKWYGSSYDEIVDTVGLELLDSELSIESPYMQVAVETDGVDFAIIKVDNYILGDTSNYQLVDGINLYNCAPGEVYHSSISLEADMILSERQLESGFDKEYLGYYEYVDSFVSEQGYKVNLLQDTVENTADDYVPKMVAMFVADGVKYTLSGRVSIEEIKYIVDTMQ